MTKGIGRGPVRWTPSAHRLGRGAALVAIVLLTGLLMLLVPVVAWVLAPADRQPVYVDEYVLGGFVIWAVLFGVALAVLLVLLIVLAVRAARVRRARRRFTAEALELAREQQRRDVDRARELAAGLASDGAWARARLADDVAALPVRIRS